MLKRETLRLRRKKPMEDVDPREADQGEIWDAVVEFMGRHDMQAFRYAGHYAGYEYNDHKQQPVLTVTVVYENR